MKSSPLFAEHRCVCFEQTECLAQPEERPRNRGMDDNKNVPKAAKEQREEKEKPVRTPEFQRKLLQVAMELEKKVKDHPYLKEYGIWEVKPIEGGSRLQFACKCKEDGKIRWTVVRCEEETDPGRIGHGKVFNIKTIKFHAGADLDALLRTFDDLGFPSENGINFGPNELGSLDPKSWARRSAKQSWLYVGDYVRSEKGLKGDIAEDPAKPKEE